MPKAYSREDCVAARLRFRLAREPSSNAFDWWVAARRRKARPRNQSGRPVGERAISHLGHIKMMRAVQPFLSGAGGPCFVSAHAPGIGREAVT
jgi:hypothetical protein